MRIDFASPRLSVQVWINIYTAELALGVLGVEGEIHFIDGNYWECLGDL